MTTVIQVEKLCKTYQLGTIGGGTLQADFARMWARMRKRPDPTLQIGSEDQSRLRGQEFKALRDVSFDVKQGEILGVIGRNGAGKSTLLKILSRVTAPTSGQVRVKGRIASLLEVGTGFHPELTGRENVFLNGAILGMSKAEIRSKFDEIVAFSGVDDFVDTPVKRYSSGMYVRLAFAVAAHLDPEILIVDEVLAVGDTEFQRKCIGKMRDVSTSDGRTVLFVSHQMGTISSLCARAILLNGGAVESAGNVQEVIEQYLYLSNARSSFAISEKKLDRTKNLIVSVQIESEDRLVRSEFSFSESININITLSLPKRSSNLLLGVALDNSLQARVFTVVRETSELKAADSDNLLQVRLQLPTKLIAPNHYFFTVALFEHNALVHDLAQGICPIRIVDDGTALSRFEGIDYGNVIVDAKWDL